MPKAPAFGGAPDEDEKTTIESGWEDEASTTVEQGDVADKLRALGADPLRRNTHITSTNGGALDEPTVDDQHANAALAMIAPAPAPTRLVITAGNDTGQALEVQPGKSYTIGRAIDNDFVLTDIAVSRKHFDLRHQDGGWILVDRGSGNGTVVNGNIEDQPFMLANGDQIEIGNTTFRFDRQNGATRPPMFEETPNPSLNATFDLDEEPSTVAGKPLREEPSPARMMPRQSLRPKTVPPPAPLPRPRPPSVAPAFGHAPLLAHPASTLPMPPMPQHLNQPRMPMLGAQAPQQLGNLLPNMVPTTLPGQGMPLPPAQPPMFGYPNVADMPAQHASHAQHAMNGRGLRDGTSTSMVQPQAYGLPMTPAPPTYVQPQLSRRTMLMLGGAALTLFAAIATVAIIKGSSGAKPKPIPGTTTTVPKAESRTAPKPDGAKPTTVTARVEPIEGATVKTPTETTKTPTPTEAVKTPTETVKPQTPTETSKTVKPETVKTPTETVKTPTETVKTPTETSSERRRRVAREREEKERSERAARTERAERERAARAERAERERAARAERAERAERERAARAERARTEEAEKPPKRTAALDSSEVKSQAERLYRSKQFKEAAALLKKASSSIGGSEGSDLRSVAAVYEQVGRNYNVGMGPATKAAEAYAALNRAANLDRGAGGVFGDEIRTKLAAVAPKAAVQYMAEKDFPNAFKAVRSAESLGAGGSSTQAVRSTLEDRAGELYAEAKKELSSDPDVAKAKFREIKSIVDGKSPWYQKATKALNGG